MKQEIQYEKIRTVVDFIHCELIGCSIPGGCGFCVRGRRGLAEKIRGLDDVSRKEKLFHM